MGEEFSSQQGYFQLGSNLSDLCIRSSSYADAKFYVYVCTSCKPFMLGIKVCPMMESEIRCRNA